MWTPVVVLLLVASVKAVAEAEAEAEAEADPEPFLPLVYPQYATTWAAQQFGTPSEISAAGAFATQRQELYPESSNFGFRPAKSPPSPLFAIRDVHTPQRVIADHRQPSFTNAFPVLRQPFVYAPQIPQSLLIHTIHLRVPDTTEQDHIPVPVTAPTSLSFASQHTAQIPFIRQGSGPTFLGLIPFPSYPSFTRQAGLGPTTGTRVSEEEKEDDDSSLNYILLPHFPTQLAPLTSLRDMGSEPVIPAGIVQSTQPIFREVLFRNDKAHPSLLDKKPAKDGAVETV
ncbi:uncharacterized protein LOC121861042 [Homarus americanus]|uniref:Uncharacterized protein n=1 Tax=Homarus americanus TaxID=6706 RepID=A0A8J5TJI1_HOMAM|nr:uncharacterized protein LOC121861042 [Homarus americanus]KAG7173147.1 hypothetical protein Hamer_G008677 [Homarus americanus]